MAASPPPSFSRAQAGQPRGFSSLKGILCVGQRTSAMSWLDPGQSYPVLGLVLPAFVGVGHLADVVFVGLEE